MPPADSKFDIDQINEIIHGRLRLGVMAYLANSGSASFTELKDALGVTQGNLSAQMRKLEDADYISVDKQIVGRKPLTTIRITRTGRLAFAAYLQALAGVLGDGLKG
jgi:DNA-binding MarR family transcriptional regulator